MELEDDASAHEFLLSGLPRQYPCFVLGGGSNVLFTKDYNGIIIRPVIKGIEKSDEDDRHVIIRAGAGEEWDGFVHYCVMNNWAGIENLSWIPGTVGASPVQNIGAYGAEIMDFIHLVEGYNIETGESFKLTAGECKFSYRDSIFKHELKNRILITRVSFRLKKYPDFNIKYPDLKRELENSEKVTIEIIREAIIKIRKLKLPDPAETGNAGSFFKNPVLNENKVQKIQKIFPDMPLYRLDNGNAKVPAAWLIEKSGWKGKSSGNAGTHKRQPLILVNHGNATGDEILQCAHSIQKDVEEMFGVELEMEVNVI
jgi:UDP-N-acetylmuramate dehydrogenase